LAHIQHPASLNALQKYRQARTILRQTSRASNPAWYQDALNLNFQLHLRPDGSQISCFYFNHKKAQWTAGPSLTDDILRDASKLEASLTEILKYARADKNTSLGVILHIADEFATTELKRELNNPAALPELRETATHNPASIIEDASISADQASWRVLPYPAAGAEVMATAVTISLKYADLLTTFRHAGEKANFPVITKALSAPLVAMIGLPQLLKFTPGKAFVAVLQYDWFTALAFFNEHADLRLIRTLQHQSHGLPERSRRRAIATSSAALEFVDPDLFIMPLSMNADSELEENLSLAFSTSRVEVVKPTPIDGIPSWCPEPAIAAISTSNESQPISTTFTILRSEKWALQDFLPSRQEAIETYPRRSEMRLLSLLRLARAAILVFTFLGIAYFAWGMLNIARQPEWSFNLFEAEMLKGRLASLTVERQKAAHWDNLLEDRSKVWTSMEWLSRLFPENGGMLIKGYSHSARPDNNAGQAKVGFVKEWKISGFARDEALTTLNKLNTRDGINAHFASVARATHNSAFDPAIGNRSISVNVRTQENSSFKPVAPEDLSVADTSTYPYTFDLTITQRFEATDPMALTVPKAP
jgi:hypothetical protein